MFLACFKQCVAVVLYVFAALSNMPVIGFLQEHFSFNECTQVYIFLILTFFFKILCILLKGLFEIFFLLTSG